MRVFITSTPEELAPHQAAACEVVRELGFEPVLRQADDGGEPLAACAQEIARADAVLALVGWRCGPVPEPEIGGDGLRPWARWEVDHAFDQGKTVRALLALRNTGSEVLILGDGAVALTGTDAADFRVTAQPAASVAAGGRTAFTVELDPSAAGRRRATVSITYDGSERPYTFVVQGTGTGGS